MTNVYRKRFVLASAAISWGDRYDVMQSNISRKQIRYSGGVISENHCCADAEYSISLKYFRCHRRPVGLSNEGLAATFIRLSSQGEVARSGTFAKYGTNQQMKRDRSSHPRPGPAFPHSMMIL